MRRFAERHWKISLVLMVLLAATASIQSYETSQDQAASARSLAARDARRIDTLFAQRDVRRHALDVERYKAALAGCRRQNVARRGSNDISQILRDAFAPVTAAEKGGKVETPLVHGLAIAAGKLKVLPIVHCLTAIPNPDKQGHQ